MVVSFGFLIEEFGSCYYGRYFWFFLFVSEGFVWFFLWGGVLEEVGLEEVVLVVKIFLVLGVLKGVVEFYFVYNFEGV